MTLQRYHSTIFDAWTAVETRLNAITWTAHTIGGSVPVVHLVDELPDGQREVVAIVPVVDDDEIEWVKLGAAGRDERYAIDILFRTEVPGIRDGSDVIARLKTISHQIQGAFYNTTTGVFSPPTFDGVVALGGFAEVRPAVSADTEGWFGSCNHRLLVAARI